MNKIFSGFSVLALALVLTATIGLVGCGGGGTVPERSVQLVESHPQYIDFGTHARDIATYGQGNAEVFFFEDESPILLPDTVTLLVALADDGACSFTIWPFTAVVPQKATKVMVQMRFRYENTAPTHTGQVYNGFYDLLVNFSYRILEDGRLEWFETYIQQEEKAGYYPERISSRTISAQNGQ